VRTYRRGVSSVSQAPQDRRAHLASADYQGIFQRVVAAAPSDSESQVFSTDRVDAADALRGPGYRERRRKLYQQN
jgi:hypothetical protein